MKRRLLSPQNLNYPQGDFFIAIRRGDYFFYEFREMNKLEKGITDSSPQNFNQITQKIFY